MKNKTGGIVLAAVSSLTFGFVPFFSVTLMDAGFSPFEVLAYRWGVATLILLAVGILMRKSFRIPKGAWLPLLAVSFFCALTAISLLIAYENITSGVASTIHFMYPLFVAAVMMTVFREPRSWVKLGAIILSLIGAGLLAGGDIRLEGGNVTAGVLWAALSVIAYGTYIVGVRKTRVQEISTLPLTVYVMGFGAVSFTVLGMIFGGVRLVPLSDGFLWANILGIARHQAHRSDPQRHPRSPRTPHRSSHRRLGPLRGIYPPHSRRHHPHHHSRHRRSPLRGPAQR